MIDVEYQIFDKVYRALREEFPTEDDLDIESEYVKAPASLPHVSIVESDNYQSGHESQTGTEDFAVITYDVNVYTNDVVGKKELVKRIIDVVDREMYRLNFKRVQMRPTPNMLDATIYRVMARYRAMVSKDEKLYRR